MLNHHVYRTFSVLCLAAALLPASAMGAELSQVIGKVRFEPRTTIVPMQVCEMEPCPKPEPYWAVVVRGPDRNYEISNTFALGSNRAPETVEIADVVIRPGSNLVFEGRVRPIGDGWAILSDITKVSYLMDAQGQAVESEDGVPVYGWSCHGEAETLPRIYADVLYQGDVAGEPSYRLRVQASSERDSSDLRPVIVIDDSRAEQNGSGLVYAGTSAMASAQLTVQWDGVATRDLRSELRVMPSSRRRGTVRTPVETVTSMLCSRSRLH